MPMVGVVRVPRCKKFLRCTYTIIGSYFFFLRLGLEVSFTITDFVRFDSLKHVWINALLCILYIQLSSCIDACMPYIDTKGAGHIYVSPTPGKKITLADRFAVLAPGCIGTMNYSATSFSIERWGDRWEWLGVSQVLMWAFDISICFGVDASRPKDEDAHKILDAYNIDVQMDVDIDVDIDITIQISCMIFNKYLISTKTFV